MPVIHRPAGSPQRQLPLMTDAMAAHLDDWRPTPPCGVVLLRAEGGNTSRPVPISRMLGKRGYERTSFAVAARRWARYKPVVALVRGLRYRRRLRAGRDNCDIVLAAENAVFGHPEVRVELLMPGAGGTNLPRLLGMAQGAEPAADRAPHGRREAERNGLVSRIVPADHLLEEGPPARRRLVASLVGRGAGP